MALIENHKYTIEQAFKDCFYIVPDYQREYVWTEEEVNQLLADIDESISSDSSEYFIGTVLVSPTVEKYHFEIIDGQQRLTTAFLILCALRDLLKGGEHNEEIKKILTSSYTNPQGDIQTSLKLSLRYEGGDGIIERLVEDNAKPQDVRNSILDASKPYGSVEKILNSYDEVYRFLTDNYKSEKELKRYWGHLANNVAFIQISTDVSNALKIFETINERGVGLNPMDLLKNLLFTQVTHDQFSKLKNEWTKISSALEEKKEKPLRFLRYFIMANYSVSNARKDAIVREDEIYDWFSHKDNAKLTNYKEDPFGLVHQIDKGANYYINFRGGCGNDGNPSYAMSSLKHLTGGGISIHHVLLLASVNLPKSLFDQFLFQLESFLFHYVFTKTTTRELERNFSFWADEMKAISTLKDSSQQRDELNRFVDKYFKDNMVNKAPELNDALKRMTLHSMQKYRIHYLLARLAQHTDMAFRGTKIRNDLTPYIKELEIEHILPNSPEDELRSSWQEANPEFNYDEIKDRLGNLTLLEKPINIVAGNDYYEKKKSYYAESGNYLTRSLSGLAEVGQNTSITRINEKLIAFDEWDAKAIERRQDMLISLIHDIWKITEIK